MLGVFIFFTSQAIFFASSARLMPLLIGVPGTIMSFFQLLIELRSADRVTDNQPVLSGRELNIIAWLAGFFIAVILLGFDYGAPLIVACYVYFVGKERLTTALVAGISCFTLMYGLFERLMGIQLFDGLLIQFLH